MRLGRLNFYCRSLVVIGLQEGLVVDVGAVFQGVHALDERVAAVDLVDLVLNLPLHEVLDRRLVLRLTKLLHSVRLDLLFVDFVGLGRGFSTGTG